LCLFLPVATSGVDCSTESPGTCMDQSVLLQHHAKITIEDQKEDQLPKKGRDGLENDDDDGHDMENYDEEMEEDEEEQGEGKVGNVKQAKGLVQAVSGAGLLQEGEVEQYEEKADELTEEEKQAADDKMEDLLDNDNEDEGGWCPSNCPAPGMCCRRRGGGNCRGLGNRRRCPAPAPSTTLSPSARKEAADAAYYKAHLARSGRYQR